MTRRYPYRNRITQEECRIVDSIPDPFGLIGVRYPDEQQTYWVSPGRLEMIDPLAKQVERELRFTQELQARKDAA